MTGPTTIAKPPEPAHADPVAVTSMPESGSIGAISLREWRLAVHEYETRRDTTSTVEDRITLGVWAYRAGLEDEAWEQFNAAIAESGVSMPEVDAYARVAMGLSDVRGGAGVGQNEALVDARRVAGIREMGLATSVTVAIKDDAQPRHFDDLRERLRRLNWTIWRLTHGQMFLDVVTIADRTAEGSIVVEKDKLEQRRIGPAAAYTLRPGTPQWQVVIAGRVATRTLAHEMLHGVFRIPDEHEACVCIMHPGQHGVRSDQLDLCDDDTHTPGTDGVPSCWSYMLARYPALVHPGMRPWGAPPEPTFVLNDSREPAAE